MTNNTSFVNPFTPNNKNHSYMPGYGDKVVMAAGAFTQGSSIELSCDAPIREPYMAFMQGGLTYEYGKLGVLKAVSYMLEN